MPRAGRSARPRGLRQHLALASPGHLPADPGLWQWPLRGPSRGDGRGPDPVPEGLKPPNNPSAPHGLSSRPSAPVPICRPLYLY